MGDLIFVMALVTVANFLLFVSGWASSNPYGAIGASRVLTQFLGYDIPLFLLALTPAFLAGNLTLSVIALSQYTHALPFIILTPWAFVLFLITLQAELEKDPFDIPHAESEVVGGLETEYGGGRLAFLHLTRDVQIVLGAALVVTFFLGGPYGPVFFGFPEFWYSLWFILKVLGVVVLTEYITCLFARLRIDQVLTANWRILLPLSIVSLALTIAMLTWVYPLVI
jgi:NADH-quinone oxidoreductase subunit H